MKYLDADRGHFKTGAGNKVYERTPELNSRGVFCPFNIKVNYWRLKTKVIDID